MKRNFFKMVLMLVMTAVLTVFMSMAVCSVDGVEVIYADETKNIEIVSGETTYLKFIPVNSGVYTFSANSEDDTYGYLFDENKEIIAEDDDGGENGNFSVTYELEAGVIYYWGACFYDEGLNGSFDVLVTCNEIFCSHENTSEHKAVEANCSTNGYTAGIFCNDCEKWVSGREAVFVAHVDDNSDGVCDVCGNYTDIELGVSKTLRNVFDEDIYLKFIPEETGKYSFSSMTYGYYQTEEFLFDANKDMLASGYEEDEDGNHTLTYNLEAGVTYYWAVRYYPEEDETASFDVMVFLTSARFDYTIDDEEITIIGCEDAYGKIVIPAEIDGYPVRYIGQNAFSWNQEITSVVISENIREIGASAFEGCDSLKKVEMGDSVLKVGKSAFSNCENLEQVIMSQAITEIGDHAFRTNSSLKEIVIPESTEKIGKEAIAYCREITEITIPENVLTIGERAFHRCYNLVQITVDEKNENYYTDENGILYNNDKTELIQYPIGSSKEDLTIAESVETICSYAFYWAEYLESVTVGDNVTDVGAYAFSCCRGLTDVKIGNGVVSIGKSAFSECNNIENMLLGEKVENIGDFAFSNCYAITEFVLPESLTETGIWVFSGCINLQAITIGAQLSEIKASTFGDCESLTDVYYKGTQSQWEQITIGANNNILQEATIHFYCEHTDTREHPETPATCTQNGYTAGVFCYDCERWISGKELIEKTGHKDEEANGICDVCYLLLNDDSEEFECKIYDGEAVVSKYTGEGGAVIIPSEISGYKVIGIGSYIFYGDWRIETVVMPEGVKFIEDEAFCYTLITEIAFPESLVNIGASAFFSCGRLTTVYIMGNIETIGGSAFYNCGITDVHYDGSQDEWEEITVGRNNECLLNATIHFKKQPHTHIYTSSVTKQPTCTATGTKTFTCSCGDTYTETINATGHKAVADKAISSTCTKTGLTEGSHCSVCKTVIKKQNAVAKKSHTYTTTTTKATHKKNGKTVTKCSVCGFEKSTATIYYTKSIKLSATTYTYNGKTKTPSVTVKDSKGKTLKKGTDYTVTYPKKRKSIGKYTVTITFKGNYSGTKKLTFEIVPAKATLSKLTAGSKNLTATWKIVSGATGYEVVYSTSKKFTKKTTKTVTIKKAKTKKTTIKKLKKGKKYFVKVRAYKTVSGKKIYGAFSSVKSVKVK